MIKNIHSIKATIWQFKSDAPWHFVTIEADDATQIKKDDLSPVRRGFGSIPVQVSLGNSTWKTSIFPDKSGSYFLPIKRSIRAAEHVGEGSKVIIKLQVIN